MIRLIRLASFTMLTMRQPETGMGKWLLLLVVGIFVSGCGGGSSASTPDEPPAAGTMAQISKVSPGLAEEARDVAMAELVKYLELYGEAPIAFNSQDGYAASRPLAVLAMAHLFRRAEIGGVQADKDLSRATTLLEVLADSYLAGEWGKASWLTSLPVLNIGVAAQIGWPDFSAGLRNKISLVIKSEADYVAGLPPLSNVSADPGADCSVSFLDVSCDSKSEENAAMASFLSFAASFYGHLDPRGNWSIMSNTFAYHTLTTPADAPYGSYKTQTIFPDGSIGNHNIFPNIHYMLATSVLAAESVLFSSFNDEVPTEYIHNTELVWDAVRENINIQPLSYNNFQSDYSNDSPLWFPSAFAYATLVLGEDEALIASLFKQKAMTGYVAIPDSKKPATVGSYDSEFFNNSNVLKRYLITWLLFANHEEGSNAPKIAPLDMRPLETFVDFHLDLAHLQYQKMEQSLPPGFLPKSTDKHGKLVTAEWGWWGAGFYPGTLWYLYEYSGDDGLRACARNRTELLGEFQNNRGTLDLGFMLYNSFGHGLRLDYSKHYQDVLLTGAANVLSRYNPNLGSLKPWDMPGFTFPVVIDNLMDLEYLLWAARITGDSSYQDKAKSHADVTMRNFRHDFSNYQIVDYDPLTGAILRKTGIQGYSDESAWARGQAWGLYGYTMLYRETRDPRYLDMAKNIAAFLLRQPNLPNDLIPYWDYYAPNIPYEKRDTSSAAIIASALVELSTLDQSADASHYQQAAEAILRSLTSPEYLANYGEQGNFLLLHGVGHLPADLEVDVSLSYSDYYFVEALMRMKRTLAPRAGQEVSAGG